MAEGVLFSIAEGIVRGLTSEAVAKLGVPWGVKDELEKLKNVVSTLKAVLLDAEELQAGSHEIKDWLENVNDAIYDADDLLDDFSTESLRREIMARGKQAKKVRALFSKSNQLFYALKMGRKIKEIREKLASYEANRRFSLEVHHGETRLRNRERDNTHSFVRAEEVIGREDDKKAVIERLMESNVEENVSILSIVGIGGLGKTTLAQLIFNDEKIRQHFQLKMWVCVSDIFHVKSIVEKILESATNTKQQTLEMNTLINYLGNAIDGKKYLLVLDDVWNEDHEKWLGLKKLLMGGERGSRILVTTRSEKVARITHTNKPYLLRGLDEHASWSLFKQMAFENGQEPENSSIMAIGREILEKCSGVPLAIRTIGRLLYSKTTELEWLSFKNNKLSKLPQTETGILPTLKLSYDQLPSHLKRCFAYCSLFPKDYEIDKSTLINLWIAQGFIKLLDQNQCLEDVGHEYFMDLLWRSFFQEAKMDEFGNVTRCKIHYLMHDLAISVAGSQITTLGYKEKDIDEKTRHVSVAYDIDFSVVIPTSLCKASRIRTLLCLNDNYSMETFDCDEIFSSFKFLRMLDLCGRGYDSLPSSICKLKHLRCLNLSGNKKLKKLPDSITTLQNLQILRLSHCKLLEELPRAIKKLGNLRHLEIDECNALTYMPCGLGQLTNLQTLSKFVVYSGSLYRHSGGLTELNKLNNLRGKLEIGDLRHGKDVATEHKAANLKEKKHLHALDLCWSTQGDVNDSDVVDDELSLEGFQPHPNMKELWLRGYLGSRLPSWLFSLTNLVRFQLWRCKKCQYLPPLSQLPSLKYLALCDMEAMQYISDNNELFSSSSVPVAFFPSLKEIHLYACPNLEGWWRKSDSFVAVNSDGDNSIEIIAETSLTDHRLLPSFPCLSELKITGCPKLTSVPMFPHLDGQLVLLNANLKLVQQTMMMNMTTPKSPISTAIASSTLASSSSTPLSKLKRIALYFIMELETLQEEWLENLISLESLVIWDCHRLKSLSQGIQHLTALQDLVLHDCRELDLANDEDGMEWQGLKSLLSLEFTDLPKLVSLPLGLQHCTTLQNLAISNCESLKAIPEWIYNCTSLQVFKIWKCSSLSSLPEGMRSLMSLRRLEIQTCPILLRRCEREIGEDWPKIAHIPELYGDLSLPQQRENSNTHASSSYTGNIAHQIFCHL